MPLFLAEEEQGGASGRSVRRRPRRLAAVGGREPEPGDVADRTLSVLVVEDDPAMRMVCTFNLEAEGMRVLAATTGVEAVELARREQPDLVLLDVMLPDLGGFEVAERLHGLPIVFVSARASEKDLEQGRRAGGIDYVTKPFDPIALASRLREDLEALRKGGSASQVWESRFGTRSDDD